MNRSPFLSEGSREMHRLLIVEDDPNLRLLYEDEFREDGYEVFLAASGEEALLAFRSQTIDAIVLDIQLGGMNGLEMMRRLLTRRQETAIVINSAYASFKSDFGSWSADRYVVKSSDLKELKTAVREVLARRAA
jgi:DNA-binding response OmpR family regulator